MPRKVLPDFVDRFYTGETLCRVEIVQKAQNIKSETFYRHILSSGNFQSVRVNMLGSPWKVNIRLTFSAILIFDANY